MDANSQKPQEGLNDTPNDQFTEKDTASGTVNRNIVPEGLPLDPGSEQVVNVTPAVFSPDLKTENNISPKRKNSILLSGLVFFILSILVTAFFIFIKRY